MKWNFQFKGSEEIYEENWVYLEIGSEKLKSGSIEHFIEFKLFYFNNALKNQKIVFKQVQFEIGLGHQ